MRYLAIAAWSFVAGIVSFAVPRADAADSYDSCTGFVRSLPATISTQGVWCLDRDLSSAVNSGPVLNIAANNVTLDCNGFKVGGLAAGAASSAVGVQSSGINATIRNCNVRGFKHGIWAFGPNAVIEDNRLDQNLLVGIRTESSMAIVRRNQIMDTGGFDSAEYTAGIVSMGGAIEHNIVYNVTAGGGGSAWGIQQWNAPVSITGNRIGQIFNGPNGYRFGIGAYARSVGISGNHVYMWVGQTGNHFGNGIIGFGISETPYYATCSGNIVQGFSHPISSCNDAGMNYSH